MQGANGTAINGTIDDDDGVSGRRVPCTRACKRFRNAKLCRLQCQSERCSTTGIQTNFGGWISRCEQPTARSSVGKSVVERRSDWLLKPAKCCTTKSFRCVHVSAATASIHSNYQVRPERVTKDSTSARKHPGKKKKTQHGAHVTTSPRD